jgi:hypothetical protein
MAHGRRSGVLISLAAKDNTLQSAIVGHSLFPILPFVTVIIEDTLGATWTLEHTMGWELLVPPTPTSPVRVIVQQNDPASGCAFDPLHGYGIVLDLSWDPPPPTVPVASYNFSVQKPNAVLVSGSERTTLPRRV